MDEQRRTLAEIKGRLLKLIDNRPFVFRDTSKPDAEKYLNRLINFQGLSENAVSSLEVALGVKFPTLFRLYLLEMGANPGDLFRGSDADPDEYQEYRRLAEEMTADEGVEPFLTRRSVIFLFHQGYTFCYFEGDGGSDAPIFQYTEGERLPKQVAPTFAEFLNSELRLMEHVNERQREQGGYYLTIRGGFVQQTHPALADGKRPLEEGDIFGGKLLDKLKKLIR